MRILKSMNRESITDTASIILKSEETIIAPDKDKEELFRKSFTKASTKTKLARNIKRPNRIVKNEVN